MGGEEGGGSPRKNDIWSYEARREALLAITSSAATSTALRSCCSFFSSTFFSLSHIVVNNVFKKSRLFVLATHSFILLEFFLAKVRAKGKKRNGPPQLQPDNTIEHMYKRRDMSFSWIVDQKNERV